MNASQKPDHPTAAEAVSAVRMALAGASTDEVAVSVIRTIVGESPPSDPKGTRSVKLLMWAINEVNARLEVPA